MSSFMSCRPWLSLLSVHCVNRTLVTKHCYTTEFEYKPNILQFVRTGMPGPVGQLCVCCSLIRVVMLLKNSGHERRENQWHCFCALKTVITANYCLELCWFYFVLVDVLWIWPWALENDTKHQCDFVFWSGFWKQAVSLVMFLLYYKWDICPVCASLCLNDSQL